MNQRIDALMGSVCRALREDILPELASDHARSQLAGVLDVLGKMEGMVAWSPDVTREQLELLEACLAQARELIEAAGRAAPSGIESTALTAPLRQGALQAALEDAERRFALLVDWVFSHAAGLPAGLAGELHGLIGQALRNTLKAQRRLVPSADFSAMTAPPPQAGAPGDST